MSLENKTSAVAEENKEQNGMVEIPHEYLIEGVKKAVSDYSHRPVGPRLCSA